MSSSILTGKACLGVTRQTEPTFCSIPSTSELQNRNQRSYRKRQEAWAFLPTHPWFVARGCQDQFVRGTQPTTPGMQKGKGPQCPGYAGCKQVAASTDGANTWGVSTHTQGGEQLKTPWSSLEATPIKSFKKINIFLTISSPLCM